MTELAAGLALGLGAGLSPGPLLALVVASSLERGFGAGLRVAVAPLLTDTPIVLLAVAAVSSISGAVLRGLGAAGGLVAVGLGVVTAWSARRLPGTEVRTVAGSRDVWRGVVVNALSPHPWIFWLSVGGPLLVSGWRDHPAAGLAFLAGFYGLLVGSKVAVAWAVARGSSRLGEAWRRRLLVVGGLALVAGGFVLLVEAVAGRL